MTNNEPKSIKTSLRVEVLSYSVALAFLGLMDSVDMTVRYRRAGYVAWNKGYEPTLVLNDGMLDGPTCVAIRTHLCLSAQKVSARFKLPDEF